MRTLMSLLLIGAVVVGAGALGWAFNWWQFSTKSEGDGKGVQVAVNVNPEKINEDVTALGQKASEIGQKATEQSADKNQSKVRGEVMKVKLADASFTLATKEKQAMTLYTSPDTKLTRKNAGIQIKDLQEGDQVTVVYKTDGDRNVALSIAVE